MIENDTEKMMGLRSLTRNRAPQISSCPTYLPCFSRTSWQMSRSLLYRSVLESLALPVEVLVDLHGRLLHHGVGFLGTADEDKIIAAGQSRVAIGVVESDAQ